MGSLSGLSHKFLHEYQETAILDLTKLQPRDVDVEIPGKEPEIDWDNLIYIKNNRDLGKNGETIVWTASGGFFRTPLSPKRVVDLRANTGVVSWLDMLAYQQQMAQEERGTGEFTLPFVLGDLELIQIGRENHSHRNWLNCTKVETTNRTVTDEKSLVLLDHNVKALVNERFSRLKRKMHQADAIHTNEQEHLNLMNFQHQHRRYPVQTYHGYEYQQQQRLKLHRLHVNRDVIFAQKLLKYYEVPVEEKALRHVVDRILKNERLT